MEENIILLNDKEKSVIRIALDLYKNDIETRLNTRNLNIIEKKI